jgi:hypothetical protein
MKESVKISEMAATALAGGDLDGAEKSLREATSAWSENELAKRLQAKIIEARKAAIPSKETGTKPTPTPTPTPTPKPKPVPTASTEPVREDAPPPETPFFKKPVFFVVLAVVVAFGAIGAKVFAKFRSADSNLLDQ